MIKEHCRNTEGVKKNLWCNHAGNTVSSFVCHTSKRKTGKGAEKVTKNIKKTKKGIIGLLKTNKFIMA